MTKYKLPTIYELPTIGDQLALVAAGLATKKVNPETGNITFKYHRKVMYNNLWKTNPYLMECRGHTYSPDGELLVLPFRKSFNYGENNHWFDVDDNELVLMYKKYNGFMAAVSNGVVSTTGTTDSDYVKLARKNIEESEFSEILNFKTNFTYLFEINDVNDPHIVKEKPGLKHLVSVIIIMVYSTFTENQLNVLSDKLKKLHLTTRVKDSWFILNLMKVI